MFLIVPTASFILLVISINLLHYQSAHAYARLTTRLYLTVSGNTVDQEIESFWESQPFEQCTRLVRGVLTDEVLECNKILKERPSGNKDIIRTFHDGKISELLQKYSLSTNNNGCSRRRKQSLCLILAYEGQYFCGWQRQPSHALPSVQETVENVIESSFVGSGRPDIRVSGRTDAGVHAIGQIARVRIIPTCTDNKEFINEVVVSLNKGAKASNNTWRCLSVIPISEKFHPTFSAVSRSYIYVIDTTAMNDLLSKVLLTNMEPNSDHVNNRLLNMTTHLNSILESVVGKMLDYYSFSYGKIKSETTLCCIHRANIRIGRSTQYPHDETSLIFELTGDRFLRRMVRMLVGTSIHLALEKMIHLSSNHSSTDSSYNDLTLMDICNRRARTRNVKIAPPGGLIFLGACFEQ